MCLTDLKSVAYREQAIRSLDQLPPFSPVLNQVLASLADEDVSFSRLAAQIEKDSVLSGNVLRLVNSALYGRRGTVSSVRAAVPMLGINKLRNYVLGISVARLWAKVRTPPSWSMKRFNDHSVAVAVLSDQLVQLLDAEYPEGAFIAGLLHDLGRLMIAIALPKEFEQIQVLHQESWRDLEACEKEILGLTHAELSAQALSRWGLPAPIQRACLYHHRSSLDQDAPQGCVALSAVVEATNEMLNGMQTSITESDQIGARPFDQVLERFGLADRAIKLLDDFNAELKAVGAHL